MAITKTLEYTDIDRTEDWSLWEFAELRTFEHKFTSERTKETTPNTTPTFRRVETRLLIEKLLRVPDQNAFPSNVPRSRPENDLEAKYLCETLRSK